MTLIVDAHAHVFDTAARSPRGVDELVPAERSATIAEFRRRLDAIGATHAVLVPLDAHDDYVAACVAVEPERFRGVLVCGPDELGRTDADPVDALNRRLERFPATAVRTMWLGEPGTSLADSPALPMLRAAANAGLVLWSYLPPDQAPFLDELPRLVPDLRVVLNHFGFTPHGMQVDDAGRPWFAEGLTTEALERVERLAAHPGAHLMYSGQYALSHGVPPYADIADATRRLFDAYGAERTIWGSDFPWIDTAPGYEAAFRLVADTLGDLSSAERAMVTGGTIARLLDITA
jgi:predicted TIM-barrel fold metal-dependent hydrolase